jgi:dihydrofolate reductase
MPNNLKIVMIAAVDRNGALGSNGALPWVCPADLRHFRSLTLGKILLMGRKTADSLPKPLPGRINLVMTRSKDPYPRPGFITVRTWRDVRRVCTTHGHSEIWIIGGGQIYERYIRRADIVHLTMLDCTVPDADTWFPMRGLSKFKGCMVTPAKDPAVKFWVFTRDEVATGRKRPVGCMELHLGIPTV